MSLLAWDSEMIRSKRSRVLDTGSWVRLVSREHSLCMARLPPYPHAALWPEAWGNGRGLQWHWDLRWRGSGARIRRDSRIGSARVLLAPISRLWSWPYVQWILYCVRGSLPHGLACGLGSAGGLHGKFERNSVGEPWTCLNSPLQEGRSNRPRGHYLLALAAALAVGEPSEDSSTAQLRLFSGKRRSGFGNNGPKALLLPVTKASRTGAGVGLLPRRQAVPTATWQRPQFVLPSVVHWPSSWCRRNGWFGMCPGTSPNLPPTVLPLCKPQCGISCCQAGVLTPGCGTYFGALE
jgi:hypothetical protein